MFLLILLIFFCFSSVKKLYAHEIISNFGRTGLLEIPTAYKVKDGTLTIGSSYVYPYLRGFINVGFFPGLEIGGTITVIRNIKLNSRYWEGYGDYKDKAFFFKYQILPEMGKFPAIAIGWDDFHGTKLFDTKYVVITKYIDTILPQNLTIGYAKGKLLNGFFSGSEILLHPNWSFIIEYAPINKDKLKGLEREKIKSKINTGIKYQPFKWFQVVFSYQRGNHFGLNLNFNFPMGGLWTSHKPIIYKLSSEDILLIKKNKQTFLYEKILKNLDFSNVKVYKIKDTLIIEYNNKRYFYESVALKKVLSVLTVLSFKNVRLVKIIIKENNIPITEIVIPAKYVNSYLIGAIDFKTLLEKSKISIAPRIYQNTNSFFFQRKLKIMPKLRTFLNDPSGFFKYALSLDIYFNAYFLNNFRVDVGLMIPIINNISTINKPLMEKPVRSDIAYYLEGKNPKLSVLSLSYINSLAPNTFVGISFGYNELMFAGIGGDLLYFFNDGRLAVGIGGDYVVKRDTNSLLGIKNWHYHNEYVSLYYQTFNPHMRFSIKAGRFLAGDKGVRFEVARIVKGFEIGFWYTYSDTSDFTSSNKNYHDKGVFIAIPLRMFSSKDTRTVGYYSLAPWTRDVGQLAGRPFDLYKLLEKKLPFYIKETWMEKE